MTARRIPSRAQLREACVTIAQAVSQTDSGAAHTVQRMLRDPVFRETAVTEAMARVKAIESKPWSESGVAVATAADRLRKVVGQRL